MSKNPIEKLDSSSKKDKSSQPIFYQEASIQENILDHSAIKTDSKLDYEDDFEDISGYILKMLFKVWFINILKIQFKVGFINILKYQF